MQRKLSRGDAPLSSSMACVCGSLVSGVMSHGGLENETTLGKGLCLWQSAGKDCLFMNQAQCIPSTIDLTTQRLIMRDNSPLGIFQ